MMELPNEETHCSAAIRRIIDLYIGGCGLSQPQRIAVVDLVLDRKPTTLTRSERGQVGGDLSRSDARLPRIVLSAFLAFVTPLLVTQPAAADPFGWPQPGGPGTPVVLTYSYSNLLDGGLPGALTAAELRSATEEAFGLWSRYAPLNFFERPDTGPPPADVSYDAKDSPGIRIGYQPIENSAILAQAYFPFLAETEGLAGDIHFNSVGSFTWAIGDAFNGFDYLEVITHEIGHAVGVEHILYADAIMGPYYGARYHGLGTAFLFPADIRAIREIYGAGVGSVHAVPEPSALLLVLTGVVFGIVTRLHRPGLGARPPP
jgi:hypothetical protein